MSKYGNIFCISYPVFFQNIKKTIRKKIRLFYFFIIACQYFAITLTASNNAIFYMTRGVPIDWLGYLGMFSALTIVLFEFPTGLLSDKFGSAVSIVVSMILRGGATLGVVICYGPAMFCLVTMISSIGATCFSGANEAWIFNKDKSIEKEMNVFFSNLFITSGSARVLGGLTGSLVATSRPVLPFILSGLILLLLSVFFVLIELILREMDQKKHLPPQHSFLINDAGDTIKIIYNNTGLVHMTVSGVFFIIFCGIPFIYWQPFFYEKIGAVGSLGFVWAGFISLNILGSSLIKASIIKRINELYFFSGITLLCGVSLFASAVLKDNLFWSIGAFLFYQFFLGIIGPLRGSIINKEIVHHKRASILSFISFSESIGSLIGFSLAGYFSKEYGLQTVYIFSLVPLFISFLTAVKLAVSKKSTNCVQ